MEEIFRPSYANGNTKPLEEWKLAAVESATAEPSVDPHVFAVGSDGQGNSAGGGDLVVLDSSSLSSSSDKLLVPDSSTSGNRTKAWDNSSSAGVEVGTTSNLPDSSSSMRGLIGLKALDEGGLSRNLLHH